VNAGLKWRQYVSGAQDGSIPCGQEARIKDMDYVFESMSTEHGRAVIDILNDFIAKSFAAYREEPVGYDFFDELSEGSRGYPSLVVRHDSRRIVGFALMHAHHAAMALNSQAEITYFIMPDHTRKGLGTSILQKFVLESRRRGVETILANISSRNEQSLRFHLKNGFRECGRFCNIGLKFGKSYDAVWMRLPIYGFGPAGSWMKDEQNKRDSPCRRRNQWGLSRSCSDSPFRADTERLSCNASNSRRYGYRNRGANQHEQVYLAGKTGEGS
jgi:phosphinothricin acetyltransferase